MNFRWMAAAAALMLAGGVAAHGVGPHAMPTLFARFADQRADLGAALALSPGQQHVWHALAAQQLANLARAEAELAALAARVKADLADPRTDLRATQAEVRATVDKLLAAHRVQVDARLAFYESLDPAQQSVVRERLLAGIERLERLRALLFAFADPAAP